jgi:hypothetical protein
LVRDYERQLTKLIAEIAFIDEAMSHDCEPDFEKSTSHVESRRRRFCMMTRERLDLECPVEDLHTRVMMARSNWIGPLARGDDARGAAHELELSDRPPGRGGDGHRARGPASREA